MLDRFLWSLVECLRSLCMTHSACVSCTPVEMVEMCLSIYLAAVQPSNSFGILSLAELLADCKMHSNSLCAAGLVGYSKAPQVRIGQAP
jgi:hypothetical protein